MSTQYCLKLLRLAEPTFLNRLGIPVEAATFISPQMTGSYRCTICRTTYTPLIYAPGTVVEAQHFHETRGGINYFVTTDLPYISRLSLCYGWIAVCEPLGQTIIEGGMGPLRCGRAEAVLVKEITAWCVRQRMESWLRDGKHYPHPLDAGVVVFDTLFTRDSNLLVPCCGPEAWLDARVAPFRFHTREGAVVFTHSPLTRPGSE
jgi:hypothetical protein